MEGMRMGMAIFGRNAGSERRGLEWQKLAENTTATDRDRVKRKKGGRKRREKREKETKAKEPEKETERWKG